MLFKQRHIPVFHSALYIKYRKDGEEHKKGRPQYVITTTNEKFFKVIKAIKTRVKWHICHIEAKEYKSYS
jgi:hypothetical protein